jgi:hypothetical protein
MLAGVKLIDKGAAEKALKEEEKLRKKEKKQLKKARLPAWHASNSCQMAHAHMQQNRGGLQSTLALCAGEEG